MKSTTRPNKAVTIPAPIRSFAALFMSRTSRPA